MFRAHITYIFAAAFSIIMRLFIIISSRYLLFSLFSPDIDYWRISTILLLRCMVPTLRLRCVMPIVYDIAYFFYVIIRSGVALLLLLRLFSLRYISHFTPLSTITFSLISLLHYDMLSLHFLRLLFVYYTAAHFIFIAAMFHCAFFARQVIIFSPILLAHYSIMITLLSDIVIRYFLSLFHTWCDYHYQLILLMRYTLIAIFAHIISDYFRCDDISFSFAHWYFQAYFIFITIFLSPWCHYFSFDIFIFFFFIEISSMILLFSSSSPFSAMMLRYFFDYSWLSILAFHDVIILPAFFFFFHVFFDCIFDYIIFICIFSFSRYRRSSPYHFFFRDTLRWMPWVFISLFLSLLDYIFLCWYAINRFSAILLSYFLPLIHYWCFLINIYFISVSFIDGFFSR